MENVARKIEIPEITIAQAKGLTDRQIDIRARKWAELDARIKALTAERDALRAELVEAGTRQTKNFAVTVTTTMRSSLDSTRLKAERPKIFAEYQKQTPQTRFTVKAI